MEISLEHSLPPGDSVSLYLFFDTLQLVTASFRGGVERHGTPLLWNLNFSFLSGKRPVHFHPALLSPEARGGWESLSRDASLLYHQATSHLSMYVLAHACPPTYTSS